MIVVTNVHIKHLNFTTRHS